ncbi:MAG: bifunctional 2-polyprenyl-6-hydroxyphenol methylase/3-demethylubiquinol 3-O-methyltransferase UbiG [Gammaproteobacteria bacterium]
MERFAGLAQRWWDTRGEMKPLHEINALRLGYVIENAPPPPAGTRDAPLQGTRDETLLGGARVLDVGCGGGILSESLAAHGARVTGIDAGAAQIAVARLHLHESGLAVDYRESTAEAMAAVEPGTFDVVTCMEMLEHVPDPDSVVRACAALTRPGGRLFFSTINRSLRAWLAAIVGAEHVLKLLPAGTHDYARFIRPSELDASARAAGLLLIGMSGMRYDPIGGSHRLIRNLHVNYIACYARPGPEYS